MPFAGLQVLSQRQDVNADRCQIAHGFAHFIERFTQAQHDAALGQHQPVHALGILQRRKRPFIAVLRLDALEQPRHCFHIVIEDFWLGIHHHFQRELVAFEIGDEHFDGAARLQLADAADDHGEDRRAAIGSFVSIDAGDDDMLQAHGADAFGDAVGLAPVERAGTPGLDITEAAAARAGVAHHQESGGALAPAFAQVGALRFFADGVQSLAAHEVAHALVIFSTGRANANPGRTATRRLEIGLPVGRAGYGDRVGLDGRLQK